MQKLKANQFHRSNMSKVKTRQPTRVDKARIEAMDSFGGVGLDSLPVKATRWAPIRVQNARSTRTCRPHEYTVRSFYVNDITGKLPQWQCLNYHTSFWPGCTGKCQFNIAKNGSKMPFQGFVQRGAGGRPRISHPSQNFPPPWKYEKLMMPYQIVQWFR